MGLENFVSILRHSLVLSLALGLDVCLLMAAHFACVEAKLRTMQGGNLTGEVALATHSLSHLTTGLSCHLNTVVLGVVDFLMDRVILLRNFGGLLKERNRVGPLFLGRKEAHSDNLDVVLRLLVVYASV